MMFLEDHKNYFKGLTLWGEFVISYNKINGGVRFTLVDCPNALSWTITTGFSPERQKIVIHATINRTQKPDEFVNANLAYIHHSSHIHSDTHPPCSAVLRYLPNRVPINSMSCSLSKVRSEPGAKNQS